MTRVLVLGENGMLGSMVANVLRQHEIEVVGSQRSSAASDSVMFDSEIDSVDDLLEQAGRISFVVNAIGIIKPRINEANLKSRLAAITVNGVFPHRLAEACENRGIRVLQIATDCVYSGKSGLYDESAPHDPTDIYGKTKSLGEVPSASVMHLRCSIIGPEVGRHTSLWEWVRSQSQNVEINGFTNHRWNGVTTFHFGKICAGIIASGAHTSGVYHVVPGDIVTKDQLVAAIASASGRDDIRINPVGAPEAIDRTLSTRFVEINSHLWSNAGYHHPPTISEMIDETPL